MATTLDLRTQDGGTAGTVTLDDAVFGIEPNMAVLHQVVTAQLAAKRSGSANTKTRAEVKGGGASHTDKRAPAELDKDQFAPRSSQVAELFMGRSREASAKK